MTTYEEIGKAFVNAICASSAIGHASAAGLADYVATEGVPESSLLVMHAFASARLDSKAQDGQAWIREWVNTNGLASDTMRRGAEAAGRIG